MSDPVSLWIQWTVGGNNEVVFWWHPLGGAVLDSISSKPVMPDLVQSGWVCRARDRPAQGPWCCCARNWPEKCPKAWPPICLAGGLWDSPVFSEALPYPLVRAMAMSGIWATFSIMETRDSFCLSIVATIKSCSHRAGRTGLEVVIQRNFCLPTPWVGPDGGIVLGVEREEWG